MIIIGTFVLAFGVALQAIIFPGAEFSPKILLDILHAAYWPIFGDLGILEEIKKECKQGNDESPCLDSLAYTLTFFLLMLYMIIANVLLINLLIAMFR